MRTFKVIGKFGKQTFKAKIQGQRISPDTPEANSGHISQCYYCGKETSTKVAGIFVCDYCAYDIFVPSDRDTRIPKRERTER